MGTRGAYGVVIDGKPRIGYNHMDSYPSGIGVDILVELFRLVEDMSSFTSLARRVTVVVDATSPLPTEVGSVSASLGEKHRMDEDWYELLRSTQGSVDLLLKAGYVLDYSDFPKDSLSCECPPHDEATVPTDSRQ